MSVTGAHVAAVGGQHTATVDVRVIMRAAFAARAAALVVGHNHLSGDPTPSAEDMVATGNLVRAGRLLNMPVLDHIIVTRDAGRFYSMFDKDTLPKAEP